MDFIKRIFIFTLVINSIFCSGSFGQITAINADTCIKVSYIGTDSTIDTIYIYNQYDTIKSGRFLATNPFGGTADFSWAKYDSASHSFLSPSQVNSGVSSSQFNTTVKGGYKLTITTSTQDTSLVFWYYPHQVTADIVKNAAGYIYRYSCTYVDLEANATKDTLYYEKPGTTAQYYLTSKLTYNWTGNPTPSSDITSASYVRYYDTPTENTDYYLTVTDNFNYSCGDTASFKAVSAEAKFSLTTEDQVDGKNSAPFWVTFTNESENANKYIWYLGGVDTITTTSTDTFSMAFYYSGTYRITLYAKNTYTSCFDTISQTITVDEPEIQENNADEFPNYFVAGQETFKPTNVSIKNYHLIIISRWGKVVYDEQGTIMDTNFKGWDGKIKGSDRYANEGVYYYFLTADPYDADRGDLKKVYKGFVYLYQNQ
jgi:hypothetical protein